MSAAFAIADMGNECMENFPVPQLVISELPDDVHKRLELLAVSHGRGLEAEARAILTAIVRQENKQGLGEAIWQLVGPGGRLTEAEWAVFEDQHDRAPAEPLIFD